MADQIKQARDFVAGKPIYKFQPDPLYPYRTMFDDPEAPLLALLEAHDWTYEMSDDHNDWRRGRRQMEAILGRIKSVQDVATASVFAYHLPTPEQQNTFLRSLSMAHERNNK
jgi:hypothetical protein